MVPHFQERKLLKRNVFTVVVGNISMYSVSSIKSYLNPRHAVPLPKHSQRYRFLVYFRLGKVYAEEVNFLSQCHKNKLGMYSFLKKERPRCISFAVNSLFCQTVKKKCVQQIGDKIRF